MNNSNRTSSDLTKNFLIASKLCGAGSYLLLFLVLFIPLYFYGKLPETIPIHFNFAGEPDVLGSKKVLFVLPGIALLLFIMMSIIPKLNLNYNYPVVITEENRDIQKTLSNGLLKISKVSVLLVFLLIEVQTVQAVLERKLFLSHYGVIIYLAIIFAPVIVYFIVARKEK